MLHGEPPAEGLMLENEGKHIGMRNWSLWVFFTVSLWFQQSYGDWNCLFVKMSASSFNVWFSEANNRIKTTVYRRLRDTLYVQSSCVLFSSLAHKRIENKKGAKPSQIRLKALGSTQSRHNLPTHFTPTRGIHVDSGTTKTAFIAHGAPTVRLCVCGCANPVCKALKQQLLH